MADLNIELFDKKVVRLQTRPSGDVEIVVSEMQQARYGTRQSGREYVSNVGGVYDTTIATIPRDSRALVADWLVSA